MTGDQKQAAPGYVINMANYELDFEDTFDGERLDESHWLPHYLPQWSSRANSAARYVQADGVLRLRIDADQPPWCPELDRATRVSSLQTGVFAGPVGSAIGQHRFPTQSSVKRNAIAARTRRSTACSSCEPSVLDDPREHGGPLDDRLRGRADAFGRDLHLRDLRA